MPTQCFLVEDNDGPRREQPGAIQNFGSADEPRWILTIPNGAHWNIYGRMSDGSPGWQISGELPNITAWPFINSHPTKLHPGWHGRLKNGVLTDDLEGRRYE